MTVILLGLILTVATVAAAVLMDMSVTWWLFGALVGIILLGAGMCIVGAVKSDYLRSR
jgi:hypothetical protein